MGVHTKHLVGHDMPTACAILRIPRILHPILIAFANYLGGKKSRPVSTQPFLNYEHLHHINRLFLKIDSTKQAISRLFPLI